MTDPQHPNSRIAWIGVLAVIGLIASASAAGATETDETVESYDATVEQFTGDGTSSLIVAVGDATVYGNSEDLKLNLPVVGMSRTPSGLGYWLVALDGGIFAYGDAEFYGSTGDIKLNRPIVGMASTPSGDGYWLVASDGGIFAYGDAEFYGSTGNIKLNKPVVGMTPTPSGDGYWLVASDGGIFAYGDAEFYGSTGDIKLNKPIVDMAASPDGRGYWFVAQDGGVFNYGTADFFGTPSTKNLTSPVVAISPHTSGDGYWIATGDGRVFGYGASEAATEAQAASSIPDGQVVGIASTLSGSGYWLATNRTGPAASIWQSGGLKDDTLEAALALGDRLGIRTTVRRWGTMALLAHRRDGVRIDGLQPGWRYSVSTLAAETGPSGVVIGGEAAAALDRGEIAVSFTSARQRGARLGDSYTVQGFNGQVQNFTIGAIVADELVGTAEMVVGRAQATSLGLNKPSSVKFWYGGESAELVAGLEKIEATARYIRSWHSWDPTPRQSDSVLSSARLKLSFGDPAFKPTGSSSVLLDRTWYTKNIQRVNLPIVGAASCNRLILDDLVAALTQIQNEGLASQIDVANFRAAGGCYNPRRIRGSSSLSRHSYGIAFDFNTSTNAFGATPTMHPRIVEIFRSNGFAWGGTWTRPDGMHFEHLGS